MTLEASTNVQVSSSQPQASTTPPEPITTDGVTSSRVPQATSGPSISAGSSDLSNTYPAIATGSVPSVASSTLSNQSGGWVTATTAPSGSGERNTTGAPIATPIISTFLTITDFTSELMATQTPPIGGIAASPPITTASIIPGSIPASTHLHPPAVRIVSAVVGSIVFIVALAILYMYVRRRISRGAIAPLAEKNVTGQPSEPILSTASSSQICQAVPDSASFDLLGNAPVSRATYADNHRPVSFEDRPLLRHSTASHSPSLLAGSIACSSMNEISESESYSLGHKIPIAEDLIHVNLPSSAAHGKSISSERRLRDTTISEESTMSEASSLGWHPSRMVRPSLAPRTRSVSYADGGVPQFGSNSTVESHVSGSLISEEMGIAM
ncbi:hypothetical protein C8Q70DRAFT_596783 [Cubamyces menziesii]|nr:hypothetical protein C8Q70DRAFT_596783 [Cubamyces menziesii]